MSNSADTPRDNVVSKGTLYQEFHSRAEITVSFVFLIMDTLFTSSYSCVYLLPVTIDVLNSS